MQPISIICPVIRPEDYKRLVRSIEKNAGIPSEYYEIVSAEDKDRIGCPQMVKQLVARVKHDLVCFLGDDTTLEPHCLQNALSAMATLPGGWGVVGLNDGFINRRLPTHWLADKRMLPMLDGEFFHTGYNHLYCDCELRDRAVAAGRYVWAEDARITHHHPALTGKTDPSYNAPYARENQDRDRDLYHTRKRAGMDSRLAIGLPVLTEKIYLQFMVSFLLMEKPDYTLLFPTFPAGEFPESVSAARNNLVEQALDEGCDRLIMMDTDQIYPPDTLTRIMAHGKDVVGTPVHRRWPPFDPILYRGTLGRYVHVPDRECYSGNLVEVDATGCGCIIYNTEVFQRIPRPWFLNTKTAAGNTVGEDIHFCHKLKEAGYKIFVDTGLSIGHLTTYEIKRETYQLYKKLNDFRYRETA